MYHLEGDASANVVDILKPYEDVLRQYKRETYKMRISNRREYVENLFNQDANIQLLTFLVKWYWKVKSIDKENNMYAEIAYDILKTSNVCRKISELISRQYGIQVSISEDDIYNSALGEVLTNGRSEETYEVLLCALENLSEIKLKEGKVKESDAIRKYTEHLEKTINKSTLDKDLQAILNDIKVTAHGKEKEVKINHGQIFTELNNNEFIPNDERGVQTITKNLSKPSSMLNSTQVIQCNRSREIC